MKPRSAFLSSLSLCRLGLALALTLLLTLAGRTARAADQVTSILGSVFVDDNCDGLENDSGTIIGNVTITLKNSQGVVVGTTTTDPTVGLYGFFNIPIGNYTVVETVPAGFTASAAVPGPGSGGTVVNTTTISVAATVAGNTYAPNDFINCQKTTSQGCTPESIVSEFNGTPISAGDTIWFNSVLAIKGLGKTTPTTVFITNAQITFTTSNNTSYTLSVPNAQITYSPTATVATTTFDVPSNTWITVIPFSVAGKNAFLSALAYPVTASNLGGTKNISWTAQFTTDTPGVTANWQWAAAVYTTFGTDYTTFDVKPTDDNQASAYKNSDHAGTPESFKSSVIGGARGGGGSNFTGSYSGTGSVTPCPH